LLTKAKCGESLDDNKCHPKMLTLEETSHIHTTISYIMALKTISWNT
jgi:hypothetical protein